MASSQGDESVGASRGERKKYSNAGEVYCYCREPAGDRFMIGCDECDEWYHGECIQLSSQKGRKIDKYYCPSCMSTNPNLITTYKGYGYELVPIPSRCTECLNCVSVPDCGKCARCKTRNGRCTKIVCLTEKEKNEKKENEKIQPPRPRAPPPLEVTIDDDTEDDVMIVDEVKSAAVIPRGEKGWKRQEAKAKKRSRRRRVKEMSSDPIIEPPAEPEQCIGPNCLEEALDGSKYCSKKCGHAMAKSRIDKHLVKAATQFWSIEPVEVTRSNEGEEARQQLVESMVEEEKKLNAWHNLVTNYANACKQLKPIKSEPGIEEEDKKEEGLMITCPVCNIEHSSFLMASHVGRCFMKGEKNTSFGSKLKAIMNPYDILCETHDPKTDSYCKRLRVLCAEHYKGDIEAGLEICAYPLVWSVGATKSLDQMFDFTEDIIADGHCMLPRKDCLAHCGWITTVLALIDVRRIRYIHQVDSLNLEDLISLQQLKTQGNAWLLMANQTEYHQPLEQILKQYAEGAKKKRIDLPKDTVALP